MTLIGICIGIVLVIVFWVQQHNRNVYLKEISKSVETISKKMK